MEIEKTANKEHFRFLSEMKESALALLDRRRRSYQLTFRNPVGEQVLADLARFCRASETTFHEDPRLHAVLEGRREVWLRVQKYLQLSAEEIYQLQRKDT